jgi:phosphinothricin acetyltransferase
MIVRNMTPADWQSVAHIYSQGLATGYATFESTVPEYHSWDNSHIKTCRLVSEDKGHILGWAALSPVSSRCVYGGVAEVSVYIAANSQGQGIGKALMQKLI